MGISSARSAWRATASRRGTSASTRRAVVRFACLAVLRAARDVPRAELAVRRADALVRCEPRLAAFRLRVAAAFLKLYPRLRFRFSSIAGVCGSVLETLAFLGGRQRVQVAAPTLNAYRSLTT
jgi:hypothetical protein